MRCSSNSIPRDNKEMASYSEFRSYMGKHAFFEVTKVRRYDCTDLRGPVVALLFETGEWVEYGHEAAVSTLEFSAARESDIGFHPCGPLDAPAGPRPPR